MSKKNFDEQLAALDDLRANPDSPATLHALRKALSNRNNFLVGKAAKVSAQIGSKTLIPELLAAMDRFLTNGAKTDPQCWAKKAIVQALADLGHSESDVFLKGLRYAQPEPVWGGQADSAGPVRSKCALALVQCRDLNDTTLLRHLLELLVDPEKSVRVDAARAIGGIERPEAALLLRLRALTGDREPEVMGACFTALLSIENQAGIDFVAGFLTGEEETAGEAAMALALMHDASAVAILKEQWQKAPVGQRGRMLLTAIALSRLPEAIDFLLELIRTDHPAAETVIEALSSAGAGLTERIREAIEASGNPRLRRQP